MAETFFCVACILVEIVWSYRNQFIAVFEYQLIVGLINPNYNSNSRLVSFKSLFPSSSLSVSNFIVLLNQKKFIKIQNFSTEKTIPYLEFEPSSSGLAVGSLNHCIIGSSFVKFVTTQGLLLIKTYLNSLNLYITHESRQCYRSL
jgi:hypothetical protein